MSYRQHPKMAHESSVRIHQYGSSDCLISEVKISHDTTKCTNRQGRTGYAIQIFDNFFDYYIKGILRKLHSASVQSSWIFNNWWLAVKVSGGERWQPQRDETGSEPVTSYRTSGMQLWNLFAFLKYIYECFIMHTPCLRVTWAAPVHWWWPTA